MGSTAFKSPTLIERQHLGLLIDALIQRNYRVVGPTIRQGAVVYDEITGVADLPVGYTDHQDGGSYRLQPTDEKTLFGYTVGVQGWKKFLFPPRARLWEARRVNGDYQVQRDSSDDHRPLALVGVRSCDLHAIAILDRVLLEGAYTDPLYRARRASLFIVAVNCTKPGGTCFCASMKTGPRATGGFDLALTEVIEQSRHYFICEVGTERGRAVIDDMPHRAPARNEIKPAEDLLIGAADHMGRSLDTKDLQALLYGNYDHAEWDRVAARCLTCGNCTLVCPTCFCVNIEDVTDLNGERAERWRTWDSCFTMDFSYIYGGSVRASARARYRQWMMHKLATWRDQFGTFGCVGCGRCITWCPVGIDITEEARTIRESAQPVPATRRKKT